MIDWQDEALMLAAQRHGETAAIIRAFTLSHGLVSGLVHGGAGRRMQPILQVGNSVSLRYTARLETHMGTLKLEMQRARSHHAMASRLGLAGMASVTALLARALPEGVAHPQLYRASSLLLDLIGHHEGWELLFPLAYLNWEVQLLAELGFALDLSHCAVTGKDEGLAYISPRSARAVSTEGAGAWASKLLPLPPVLLGQGEGSTAEVLLALSSTGYFVEHRLFEGEETPPARARLIETLSKL